MRSDKLSLAYVEKATIRIKALHFLHGEKGYSDVVREAQECVDLLLKALLRHIGIEIPKSHDVSHVLRGNVQFLPQEIQKNLDEVCNISRTLRKDREMAFYGTEDWIPTEEYSVVDSETAIKSAEFIFSLVAPAILPSSSQPSP
jgi:HEPN domain-containing protein